MGSVRRKRSSFEFRGDVPCLDFVNTMAWRRTDRPVEYLGSYEDLLVWGRQADLLSSEEAEALSGRAATDPDGARAAMWRATALREALHRALSAPISGETQDEGTVTVLNRELSGALSRLRVTPSPGDAWAWDPGRDEGGPSLDRPLWPVARSAADLMTSPKLGRVKVCAGEGCGWMFLDESRNSSRLWYDSRDCGNRERVRIVTVPTP